MLCVRPAVLKRAFSGFTHTGTNGEARMVDVGGKAVSERLAVATGKLQFSSRDVLPLIKANNMKKGDVLAVARVAGIMAAKQTPQLIPLCHNVGLTKVENCIYLDFVNNSVHVRTTTATKSQTGVEMEALVGASITLNTIYDMCKSVDRHMKITDVEIIEKKGGTHDFP